MTAPQPPYRLRLDWPVVIFVAGAFVLAGFSDLLGCVAWTIGVPLFYVIGRREEAAANAKSTSSTPPNRGGGA